MKQSKTVSFIEATLNIASGFLISLVVWLVVGPMFGYAVPIGKAFGLTAVFTITSILRAYAWRRIFVRYLDKRLHKWLH